MAKEKIGIDFDDVAMDTFTDFLAFCNQRYGEQFQVEDFVSFEYDLIWKISKEERLERFLTFHRSEEEKNIRPMPGAKEALMQLKQWYEPHIITARPLQISHGTHETINRCFPGIFHDVHFCSTDNGANYHRPKPLVCKEIDVILHIDDHPQTARHCAQHGVPTFLFDRPWNRSEAPNDLITRVSSWDEILTILCQS